MIFGKYNSDYKLRESVTPGGRTSTEAVYVGSYFRFADRAAAVRTVHRAAVVLALAAAAYIVPLVVFGDILRKWYVIIPLVLDVLPLSQLIACTAAAYAARDGRVTRKGKDKISERLAPWSAVLMILSSLSLAGQIFFDVTGSLGWLNAIVHVCTAVLIAAGAALYKMRDGFRMTVDSAAE